MPYSSCHFPNHRPVFLQVLHHSSVSWKITSLCFFRSSIIYFAQKEPIKKEILRISRAQVKIQQMLVTFETTNCCFFTKFASLASVMRHNSSILFLDEILCSFNKRSLSKYIFGEISREQSKI